MKLTAEQKRNLTTFKQVRHACLKAVKQLRQEQADLLAIMWVRWPNMARELVSNKKARFA